ncbi:hypothetical protein SNE40_013496 [Patella caerulea]
MLTRILFVILSYLTGVLSIQCAKYDNLFARQPTYISCAFECCGIGSNRHCCIPAYVIVLLVLGGLTLLGATAVLLYCLWKRTGSTHVVHYSSGSG